MKQLGYDVNKTSLTIETFLDTKLYKKVVDEVNNMKYLDSKQQIGVSVIVKMDSKSYGWWKGCW